MKIYKSTAGYKAYLFSAKETKTLYDSFFHNIEVVIICFQKWTHDLLQPTENILLTLNYD